MEKKHVAVAVLVVVAIVAVLAYPSARFALFTLKARETVEKLPRFASPEQVLALPDALKQDAARYRLDPAKVTVRLVLEERSVMGAVAWTFLLVTVSEGPRSWSYSVGSQAGRRVETPIESLLGLEEEGVEVRRAPSPEPPSGE